MVLVINFNIMSSLAMKYYFTDGEIYMNGISTTLDKIHSAEENYRIAALAKYLKEVANYHKPELISLEEVSGEWLSYFSTLLPSYIFTMVEIRRPRAGTNKFEKYSDFLVTYIRKGIYYTDFTQNFQSYYEVRGNKSSSGFAYPARAQIFKVKIKGKTTIYAHIHPGGDPNSDGKKFFEILSSYISEIPEEKVLVIGDFNRDKESGAMISLENINLKYHEDNRATSYHGIIMKRNPSGNYYYYKNGLKGQTDERFFKKLDNLFYKNISVKKLTVLPRGGITVQQPYTITKLSGQNNNLGEYVIKSAHFVPNGTWFSDHSMMIYDLLI